MKIIGFYGWSGSGKTDIICRVINHFSRMNLFVSTIKHTHHNIEIDKKGKDSFSHRIAGAREVLVGGKKNWALIHRGMKDEMIKLENLLEKFSNETDVIIIEGFKKAEIPKIEVYNSNLNKKIIGFNDKNTIGIVYDKLDENVKKSKLPKFDFKESKKISNFILDYFNKNARK